MADIDESQVALLTRMNDLLREQVQLKRALGRFDAGGIREVREEMDSTDQSASNATESVTRAAKETGKFGDAAEDAGEKGGFFSGLFEKIKERSSAFVAGLSNMAQSLFSLGQALFNLMSGGFILDGIIEKAQSMGSANTAFAEAREEVREFAGDLKSGLGRDIMDSYRGFSKTIDDFGVSMRRVYGYGISGMAARLKDVNDLFQKLGASAENFSDKLVEMAGEVVYTGKALGIGNEGMAEMLRTAEAIGTDGMKYMRDFQREAVLAHKYYGVSAKVMGRGMNDLMKTLPHLQREGAKAFAPIVAYAQKMGLELKQVTGILETFSSADKALEAASNLAQIGVALDPIEMIAEKDPAKMLLKIGESIKSSGKQIDLTDRHTRSYLKSTLQLDDATLDRIASENGLTENYKKTAKAAEDAKKKQMSQQEVLEELGKGIKRIIQAGSSTSFTGFFDALKKGFLDGMLYSGPMLRMFRTINRALKDAYWAGRALGRMFVETFPGIKDMLAGIAKLFDRSAGFKFLDIIKTEFGKLLNIFDMFSKGQMLGRPEDFAKSFFERLFGGFKEYKSKIGSFWENIMPGLLKFTEFAGKFIKGFILFIGQQMVSGLKSLASVVRNGIAGGGGEGPGLLEQGGSAIMNLLRPIWEGLSEAWPEIWKALKDLFSTVWEKLQPVLSGWANDFMNWMSKTFDSLSKSIREGYNGAPSALSRMKDSFIDLLSSAWNALVNWWDTSGKPKLDKWWNDFSDDMVEKAEYYLGVVRDKIVLSLEKQDSFLGNRLKNMLLPDVDQLEKSVQEAAKRYEASGMSETEAIIKANSENEKKIFDGKQKARSERQSAEAAAQAAQAEAERKDRIAQREYERNQAEAAKRQLETANSLASTAPQMSVAAAELGKSMVQFSSDTVTAGQILTSDNVATTSIANLSENFKAGKLEVSHNLPNTNISLNISLSSEKIASEMYKVNLGAGEADKFMQGGPQKTTGVRAV